MHENPDGDLVKIFAIDGTTEEATSIKIAIDGAAADSHIYKNEQPC